MSRSRPERQEGLAFHVMRSAAPFRAVGRCGGSAGPAARMDGRPGPPARPRPWSPTATGSAPDVRRSVDAAGDRGDQSRGLPARRSGSGGRGDTVSDQPGHRDAAAGGPGRVTPANTTAPSIGRRGLPRLADGPAPAARRGGPPDRRGPPRPQGRPGPADHPRDRQDPHRGRGRGPGDDRHVRLRRRPVAPALRPDDRQRAAAATG